MPITLLSIVLVYRAKVDALALERDHRIARRLIKARIIQENLGFPKLKGVIKCQRKHIRFIQKSGRPGRKRRRDKRQQDQGGEEVFHRTKTITSMVKPCQSDASSRNGIHVISERGLTTGNYLDELARPWGRGSAYNPN